MSTCHSRRRVRAITTIALPRQFWLFVSARMIDVLQCFDLPLSEGLWSRVMESAIPVTITN